MGGLVLSDLCVLSLQLIKHMAPGCLSVNNSSGQQTQPTSSAAGSPVSHTPLPKQEQQRIQPNFRICFKPKTSAGQNSKSLLCMVAALAFHKVIILSRNELIYPHGSGPPWIRCRLVQQHGEELSSHDCFASPSTGANLFKLLYQGPYGDFYPHVLVYNPF